MTATGAVLANFEKEVVKNAKKDLKKSLQKEGKPAYLELVNFEIAAGASKKVQTTGWPSQPNVVPGGSQDPPCWAGVWLPFLVLQQKVGSADDSPWTVTRPPTFGGVTKAQDSTNSKTRILVRADMVFDKTFEDWKDWPQHCRMFFHQAGDFPVLSTRTRARSIHCPLTHSLTRRPRRYDWIPHGRGELREGGRKVGTRPQDSPFGART